MSEQTTQKTPQDSLYTFCWRVIGVVIPHARFSLTRNIPKNHVFFWEKVYFVFLRFLKTETICRVCTQNDWESIYDGFGGLAARSRSQKSDFFKNMLFLGTKKHEK